MNTTHTISFYQLLTLNSLYYLAHAQWFISKVFSCKFQIYCQINNIIIFKVKTFQSIYSILTFIFLFNKSKPLVSYMQLQCILFFHIFTYLRLRGGDRSCIEVHLDDVFSVSSTANGASGSGFTEFEFIFNTNKQLKNYQQSHLKRIWVGENTQMDQLEIFLQSFSEIDLLNIYQKKSISYFSFSLFLQK